jgi:hypothetical protein
MHTLAQLGLAVGLRLEVAPMRAAGKPSRTKPPLLSGTTAPSWSRGHWPRENADYLLALAGAELRHVRRYLLDDSGIRSSAVAAVDANVSAATILRLERPARPYPSLPSVLGAALAVGYEWTWVDLDEQWRPRSWQLAGPPLPGQPAQSGSSRNQGRLGARFTSGDQTWTTPRDLFNALDAEFGFTLDAAALQCSALCDAWLGPDHPDPRRRDALIFGDWAALAREAAGPAVSPGLFLNPPYGGDTAQWLSRAAASARAGVRVCVLIPCRTDTKAWHDHVIGVASQIRYLRGRLRYGDGSQPAPFPSAVVIYEPLAGG